MPELESAMRPLGIMSTEKTAVKQNAGFFSGCIFVVMVTALCTLAPKVIAQESEKNQNVEIKADYDRPFLIRLEGAINNRRLIFLEQCLRQSKRAEHDLIILEVDSPGGGLDESLLIAEMMRDIDWADTIAFVPQKALSGGALISLGCDKIVMTEHARIGDAGVIMLDPSFMFRYAPEKIMSDLVRRARDIASANGHPEELAEAMIDRSAVVYVNQMPAPGEDLFRIEYVKEESNANSGNLEEELEQGKWKLVKESIPNRFLEVNGNRAVELGLASRIVTDRQELFSSFEFSKDPSIREYRPSDALAYYLSRTWAMGLLVVIGLVALYVELSAPGISVGGLIAVLCFGLFFWSRFFEGTSGWLEVLLFLAGIGFLLAEVFVVPGTGLTGIIGIGLLIGSVLMASHGFVVPSTNVEWQQLGVTFGVLLLSIVGFFGFVGIAGRFGHRLPLLNRFVLGPPELSEAPETGTIASDKLKSEGFPSVGDWGLTESICRPYGKARFGQRTLDVVSDGGFVDQGVAVQVQQVRGRQIVVRAEKASSDQQSTDESAG